MTDILVVTSPSGHIGNYLLPVLYKQGTFQLRLAAHSQASVTKLKAAYPNAEVRASDITLLDECRKLLDGATSVFHVGPSFHSQEKEMGFNMIDAAIEESRKPKGVFKHFVFSSVLCTQHRSLMQHDLKSYVEERLMLSPLNYTILQPTNFMDAWPIQLLASQDKPVVQKLWTAEIPNSVVSLHDLADAAVKVLAEREKHYLAQYPICSTMPVSDAEIAKEIGRQLGKEVEIRTPSFEDGVENLLRYLFGRGTVGADNYTGGRGESEAQLAPSGDPRPDITRDGAERLILFYNRKGLRGSPTVLRWLLGREPTTIEQYVQGELERTRLA
jgi:uncharacterized protein YbjT (DUF2867 family)